jgi:hypothetical protein
MEKEAAFGSPPFFLNVEEGFGIEDGKRERYC